MKAINQPIIFLKKFGIPHWHDDNHEGELEWLGLEKTEQLFFQKVKQKFGYFDFAH